MKKAVIALLFTACATAPTAPPAPAPPATAAPAAVVGSPATAADIQRIEDRLADTAIATLRYNVETSGSATFNGRGSLLWRPDILRFDVTSTLGQHGDQAKSKRYEPKPIPPNAKRAVIEGLVRMGLGHNVYRLVNGQGIDGEADGLQGVEVANVRFVEAERSYLFDIMVKGARVGQARLWLTPDGRPARRQQTVHAPGGDMNVVETYQWLM